MLARFHLLISTLVAVLLPVLVYAANGEVELEVVVLGAVSGLAYWYWGPWSPTI